MMMLYVVSVADYNPQSSHAVSKVMKVGYLRLSRHSRTCHVLQFSGLSGRSSASRNFERMTAMDTSAVSTC